jgi:hypothetical protein
MLFNTHRGRILLGIITLIIAGYYLDQHPKPPATIKKECGTIQLRKVVTESRYNGSTETYYDAEIPTIIVKFPTKQEKIEIGIDVYDKLRLRGTYCRYNIIKSETPSLVVLFTILFCGSLLWIVCQIISGILSFDLLD